MYFWTIATLYGSCRPPIIEDALRRDTAAPSFWSLAFRDPFRQVAPAGLCLPFLCLILFDLVRSLADLVRILFVFCRCLQKPVQKTCPKTTTNALTVRSTLQKIEDGNELTQCGAQKH
jgi:hypothetical protein